MCLLPILHQVQGQASLSAESLNAMTQPERVRVLQAAFVQMQPAIDESAKSWDSMAGAVVSDLKLLTRLTTKPLFEGMKKGLDQINNLLFEKKGEAVAGAQQRRTLTVLAGGAA